MDTVTRTPRSSSRDVARSRTHGLRRFHPAEPQGDAGQPPVEGEDLGAWPGPDRPSGPDDTPLQWPFWIVLVVPWLTLTAAFILEHLNVCLICLGDGTLTP